MTADHNKNTKDNLLLLSSTLEGLTSEGINARSARLDQMSALEIAQVMNSEDQSVASAVEKVLPQVAEAIDRAHAALRAGGRIIYVGAGTSGRLGVLDASEIPPTFSAPPSLFHAIIAGGQQAIFQAQEGIEDDRAQGALDLAEAQVSEHDLVIGLAVSGRTPYVLAALEEAHERGADTVGVSCNPGSALEELATIGITPEVGPEILAGSTRLKSGTAQKMVLNMISTGAMVRLGKCYQNRMVDLNITNEKLRARALNLVRELTDADKESALHALVEANWDVKVAIVICKTGIDAAAARVRIEDAGGHLRQALDEAN
ncbi:N-acetylmuramic acid 6-phosphate etherase [Maritalea mediterranea]|uniref:N-acetylmuramic acid 6-phosphate etherase n=1 Tax=Maritalea mediterranea TaxID=2909667 RepID=A0ABS9E3J4_9HYPH|nr:N-acetylmuramic acid 6-phosphate etherase [Maritalea mediterranea]MCF4097382.1 N-acetylmuramic acid 6-phosphate etherase [Maritalea mediterranea]